MIAIKYTFERDIMKSLNKTKLDNNEFIGKTYLITNNIHPLWFPLFKENQDVLCNIFNQLNNFKFYPKYNEIFNAFTVNPLRLKCILVGQDCYHGSNQAHGYSFSVNKDVSIPPSLVNIFKEINIEYPNTYDFIHGNLEEWAKRDEVLLLNAALTVLPKTPNSHAEIWKEFTDNVIVYISTHFEHKVFLLLGSFAKKKSIFIDEDKHKIITGIHPSPLSAHTGYFNSGIFKKVDNALMEYGINPINWQN